MSCHKVYSLPDIDMYGGDTTPWEVYLVYEDGTNFPIDENTTYTCTLTLSPFGVKSTVTNTGSVVQNILTRVGTVHSDATIGSTLIRFEFRKEDTINLRGKFLYQIDVCFGNDVRICQGVLNIRQNVSTH